MICDKSKLLPLKIFLIFLNMVLKGLVESETYKQIELFGCLNNKWKF